MLGVPWLNDKDVHSWFRILNQQRTEITTRTKIGDLKGSPCLLVKDRDNHQDKNWRLERKPMTVGSFGHPESSIPQCVFLLAQPSRRPLSHKEYLKRWRQRHPCTYSLWYQWSSTEVLYCFCPETLFSEYLNQTLQGRRMCWERESGTKKQLNSYSVYWVSALPQYKHTTAYLNTQHKRASQP